MDSMAFMRFNAKRPETYQGKLFSTKDISLDTVHDHLVRSHCVRLTARIIFGELSHELVASHDLHKRTPHLNSWQRSHSLPREDTKHRYLIVTENGGKVNESRQKLFHRLYSANQIQAHRRFLPDFVSHPVPDNTGACPAAYWPPVCSENQPIRRF